MWLEEEVEKLIVKDINNLVSITFNMLNLTPSNINTEISDTGVSGHYLHPDKPNTNSDKISPPIQLGFPNRASTQS